MTHNIKISKLFNFEHTTVKYLYVIEGKITIDRTLTKEEIDKLSLFIDKELEDNDIEYDYENCLLLAEINK